MHESLTNMTKCLRCRERGAARIWHAKQPYREYHSITLLGIRWLERWYILSSIPKQLVKLSRVIGQASSSSKTLRRPEKHSLLKYSSRISTDIERTCVLCIRSLERLRQSLRKSSHAGRHFLCKKRPRRTCTESNKREFLREREIWSPSSPDEE